MSTKLSDLAKSLNIEVSELKVKIKDLGFEISPRARVVDDDVAELVLDELSEKKSTESDDLAVNTDDIVDVYDELIAEEREREIVKTQRKKTSRQSKGVKQKHSSGSFDAKKAGVIEINDSIAVKEFAEKTGINVAKIIGALMKNGILANINQQIDFDTAHLIADDFGVELKRIRAAAAAEDLMSGDLTNLLKEDDASVLKERPSVVCVMGHVDHGKTKLLDSIRNADVVAGESGGITQHIAAYQVNKKGKSITFLDTPGHEAFTSMRARGAKVTDIAILVVAADEGMKPQTIEALNHAREAGVPIIVAANKMDKPEANLEKLKGELTEHGLQPEDWGGSTVVVPISALKGDGIDDLLDMVLLTSEMEELKANPDRDAVATVVEAHLDQGLGPVATVLVNTGTLKIMNNFVVGNTYGRIRVMKDYTGKQIRVAGPSVPVLISGFDKTPKSGDILQVVADEKTARLRAAEITILENEENSAKSGGASALMMAIKSEKVLKLILKADAKGSLEAIKQSIAKIKDEEVAVKIIHDGVGRITESDIMMASASNALVASFHSDYDSPNVAKVARKEGVEVKSYTIIYDLLEDIKRYLTGLLDAEIVQVVMGRAEVKQVFLTKKKELILGLRVLSGKAVNKAKIKVLRGRTKEDEDNIIGEGRVMSLKKGDETIKEINEGNDCGMKYAGDVMDILPGDIFEMYVEEERHRTVE